MSFFLWQVIFFYKSKFVLNCTYSKDCVKRKANLPRKIFFFWQSVSFHKTDL